VRADVALLWDWESFWAQDQPWRPSVDLGHRERVEAFYTRLWRDGLTVDFAHPGADLSGYRLVVAPQLYLVTESSAANLRRYVEGGGQLLVSYFSGVVDEHDAVHPQGLSGPLGEVLGARVEEWAPLRADERVTVAGESWTATGDVWSEHLRLAEGTEVLARFADGPAAGGPAFTGRDLGRGRAWYLSTRLPADDLAAVLAPVYAAAGLVATGLPAELELVRRSGPQGEVLFCLNHGEADVVVEAEGTDLLDGSEVSGELLVPAGGVRVVATSS
jgi:beta-galactosidase